MEGWIKSGKFSKKRDIKFDCANCSEFYSKIVSLTGIDTNSKETNLAKIKEGVGCCQSIEVINNLDDKVDIEKLKAWLSIFKDIMCGDCEEVVKLASVEILAKIILVN